MTPHAQEEPTKGANLLELVPRTVASWSEDGGVVVLRRERPAKPWRTPFQWLGYSMGVKSVRLDEIGSFAWRCFDGVRTVGEVAANLREEFGERVEPVEERFGQLIHMLRNGGFIALGTAPASELGGSLAPPREPR